ncbi:hypothetical protein Patl1_32905 [Pistacia atlantica]|uniref:Uncharacterized protein n=1 Tax=Pistacia atlantica TaxID=434234 RepID=A0ACC1AMJ6_9ROSI|nr:hypothetical protein Patl1_32905 [Pistacia atlantica]
MKISSLLFPPLLLLLLLRSGDDFGPSLVVNIVLGARIPEHTCHKLIEMKKCEIEKCNQRCSEFPNAVGEYSASYSHLSPKLKWQRKELYKRSNEMESMAVVLPLKGSSLCMLFFIGNGHLETTWVVLRKFGYGDDLELRDECLPVPPKLPPNQSVELASEVVEFLCSIFGTYDKENDRAQSPIEHEDLFSTTPES